MIIFSLLIFCTSCSSSGKRTDSLASRNLGFDTFGDYRYQGKAELDSYHLEQYRYGEKREGEAVLIFVAEDISREKQLKLDNPQSHHDDRLLDQES